MDRSRFRDPLNACVAFRRTLGYWLSLLYQLVVLLGFGFLYLSFFPFLSLIFLCSLSPHSLPPTYALHYPPYLVIADVLLGLYKLNISPLSTEDVLIVPPALRPTRYNSHELTFGGGTCSVFLSACIVT